jgi:hypothetical protein
MISPDLIPTKINLAPNIKKYKFLCYYVVYSVSQDWIFKYSTYWKLKNCELS